MDLQDAQASIVERYSKYEFYSMNESLKFKFPFNTIWSKLQRANYSPEGVRPKRTRWLGTTTFLRRLKYFQITKRLKSLRQWRFKLVWITRREWW
jgi:hypothetical protein